MSYLCKCEGPEMQFVYPTTKDINHISGTSNVTMWEENVDAGKSYNLCNFMVREYASTKFTKDESKIEAIPDIGEVKSEPNTVDENTTSTSCKDAQSKTVQCYKDISAKLLLIQICIHCMHMTVKHLLGITNISPKNPPQSSKIVCHYLQHKQCHH